MTPHVPTTAVGLLSGGLDSVLAARLLLEQGVRVVAYHLFTPFTSALRAEDAGAVKLGRNLGIECVVEQAGPDYFDVLKKPRFGRGAAFNPCIDCHLFMLGRARTLMGERGGAFVFTGEVLGQRPMSQTRRALDLLEREAGLEGRLLRPLSARRLPPTLAEREGLVDRERLWGIEGRSRKTQLEWAARWELEGWGTPAGGCLLTDTYYGARVREAFAHGEDTWPDMELLRFGRHFRLPAGAKVILGKCEEENVRLLAVMGPADVAFQIADAGSPVALLRGGREGDEPAAAALALRYSDARARDEAPAVVYREGRETARITARREDAAEAALWKISR
jgi:tRNA-specific 2-thiouridylase